MQTFVIAILCYRFEVQASTLKQAQYKALRKLDAMLGIKTVPKRTTLPRLYLN